MVDVVAVVLEYRPQIGLTLNSCSRIRASNRDRTNEREIPCVLLLCIICIMLAYIHDKRIRQKPKYPSFLWDYVLYPRASTCRRNGYRCAHTCYCSGTAVNSADAAVCLLIHALIGRYIYVVNLNFGYAHHTIYA